MSGYRHRIVFDGALDAELASSLSLALGAPEWVGPVLSQRGAKNLADARRYLGDDADAVADPSLIPGFLDAVEALCDAKANDELVGVFGDYDMDGIAGAALLVRGLRLAGIRSTWRLPSRFRNGYGMHRSDLESLRDEGVRWLLTVDTGISATEEIELATQMGMRVIVLDHHLPSDPLPQAFALLDPHLPGCEYPNKALCGAGLAWKFMRALLRRLGAGDGLDLLEYMALGTLADLVRMTPENRALVRRALRAFPNSRWHGIRLLGAEACPPPRVPGSQDVLFRMTPLLNAAGRLGDPKLAMQLLLADHSSDAMTSLAQLRKCNEERKKVESDVGNAAQEMGEHLGELPPVVVLYAPSWHLGVVGIVAARLVSAWNRPVAVLGLEPSGEARASARGVQGFDWHRALSSSSDLLVRWGGHPGAAGFSIPPEHLDRFRDRMVKAADDQGFIPGTEAVVRVHARLPLSRLDEQDMEWMARLEPFGPGTEEPVFLAEDVRLAAPTREIRGGHLQLSLTDGKKTFPVTAFGMASLASTLERAGSFSVAYTPGWNHFRGRRTLQLLAKGFAASPVEG